jgi:hypothetical protein
MKPFKEFNLGHASAELESTFYPDLLLTGYFDLEGLVDRIQYGPTCLVLGYKGSGKSALGAHLQLQSDPKLFVKTVFLSDFPFSNFQQIISGRAEPESKFPTAWSWILLLSLIDSFSTDIGSPSNQENDFLCSLEALQKLGLLPNPTLKQLVLVSSKKQFKAKLPPIFEVACEIDKKPGQDLQFLNIVEHLKRTVSQFKSESRHILIIDGLDDILTKKEVQYDSLAALVLEVSRLNLLFHRNSTPAKIVLLCRTELFERLPGPNKNKIRQDAGVELDWYHDPREPMSSNLVKLVNFRAKMSDESIEDLFKTYFPKKFDKKPILQFLLDLSRHTPRDFIQILSHIQKFCKKGKVINNQVLSGIRSYSINYFLPEIRDELVGYTNTEYFDNTMKMIGALKKRHFNYEELKVLCDQQGILPKMELEKILTHLYNCSAIGNLFHRPTGSALFSFKFRNRNSVFDNSQEIILHKGLWKAMNLV